MEWVRRIKKLLKVRHGGVLTAGLQKVNVSYRQSLWFTLRYLNVCNVSVSTKYLYTGCCDDMMNRYWNMRSVTENAKEHVNCRFNFLSRVKV